MWRVVIVKGKVEISCSEQSRTFRFPFLAADRGARRATEVSSQKNRRWTYPLSWGTPVFSDFRMAHIGGPFCRLKFFIQSEAALGRGDFTARDGGGGVTLGWGWHSVTPR